MKRNKKDKSASDTPTRMLRGIETSLHPVHPASSFRHYLLENLSLAAQHKITGEPIIGGSYPKDQPLVIAILLTFGAVFLTVLFFVFRPRDIAKTKSGQVLAV